MKYKKTLISVITAMVIFSGCTNNAESNKESESPSPTVSESPVDDKKDKSVQGTIGEYFPLAENALYEYERDDIFGSSTSYIIYTEDNKMQRITKVGDIKLTEVFEYANGELVNTYAHTSASGFENFLNMQTDFPLVILKEPLQIGNTWETYTGPTSQGVAKGVSTITDVGVNVETPFGSFEAIEVSTEYENGYTNVDYYAKGIGLVKNGYYNKGFKNDKWYAEDETTALSLKKIDFDSALGLDINVFYPNENVDDLETSVMQFDFNTNDDLKKVFERALKSPTDNSVNAVISENTVINNIDVTWESFKNPETNVYEENATVHLDLSKDFINDMNAGSGYETLLIQSLEYTFTTFYNAKDFVLTIDSSEYVPKH